MGPEESSMMTPPPVFSSCPPTPLCTPAMHDNISRKAGERPELLFVTLGHSYQTGWQRGSLGQLVLFGVFHVVPYRRLFFFLSKVAAVSRIKQDVWSDDVSLVPSNALCLLSSCAAVRTRKRNNNNTPARLRDKRQDIQNTPHGSNRPTPKTHRHTGEGLLPVLGGAPGGVGRAGTSGVERREARRGLPRPQWASPRPLHDPQGRDGAHDERDWRCPRRRG